MIPLSQWPEKIVWVFSILQSTGQLSFQCCQLLSVSLELELRPTLSPQLQQRLSSLLGTCIFYVQIKASFLCFFICLTWCVRLHSFCSCDFLRKGVISVIAGKLYVYMVPCGIWQRWSIQGLVWHTSQKPAENLDPE